MKWMWIAPIIALALVVGAGEALAQRIVVEAQSFYNIKPSMVLKADREASGGRCIEVPLKQPRAEETGPADDGHAEYRIRIPADGAYQFWGRCWWYDSCGNSFFILVNTDRVTEKTPIITGQTYKRWHWVAGPVFNLKSGTYRIRIQYREDGPRMDQFILTTTPRNRWQPTRIERETPQHIIRRPQQ